MVTATGELKEGGPLPRLAVVSDVAVERTAAGSLLLHRLLSDYPPDRLLAVDAGRDDRWDGDRKLPGVQYISIPYSQPRLARTRFNPAGPLLMTALAGGLVGKVLDALRPFSPDIILTVTSKYLWIPAAAAARRLSIPLALILHDDWPSYETNRRPGLMHTAVRWGCRRSVGHAYRQAATRICVSPGMVEQCQAWFARPGVLLYPNRGTDSPPGRIRVRGDRSGGPVVAFCGHVHQDGTLELMRELAEVLAGMNGRLDLYTPHSAEVMESWGLRPPVVRRIGFLHPHELADRLGDTADALFLPASFQPRERVDVATLFPSKLADYTAIGLPILIWGPEYSSAVRWASDNPGVAAVAHTPDPARVAEILRRVINDRQYAMKLAERAAVVGDVDFGLVAAREKFLHMTRMALI